MTKGPKKQFQFYQSPPAVVERLVQLAELESGLVCLEPSAGPGAIATELLRICGNVVCYEINHEASMVLKDRLAGRGDWAVNTFDFLQASPTPEFDRVVMNPPFTRGQDMDHVRHAAAFVKPGGLLVSVMSPGRMSSQDKRAVAFREWLDQHEYGTEQLPDNSFRTSGTNVNTIILVIRVLYSCHN